MNRVGLVRWIVFVRESEVESFGLGEAGGLHNLHEDELRSVSPQHAASLDVDLCNHPSRA
jgi:hypothetical protein